MTDNIQLLLLVFIDPAEASIRHVISGAEQLDRTVSTFMTGQVERVLSGDFLVDI